MRTAGGTRKGSFWEYYGGVFTGPRRAFAGLLTNPRRLRYGAGALLISALLYSFVILLLALAGGEPVIPPLLDIPAQDYYSVQVFMMAPVMFAAWMLASGVVHVLSKPLGGRGTFEDTLALLGFGTVPPTYVTLVPDGVSGALSLLGVIGPDPLLWTTQPGFGQVLSLGYLALYVLWFFALFPIAVAAAQKLSRRRSIVAGIVGFLVYQSLLLIFVR